MLQTHLLHSAVHTVCGRNFKTEESIKHNKETPKHLLGMKNWDPKELMMKDLVDKEMGRSGCCFLLVSFFFFFLFFSSSCVYRITSLLLMIIIIMLITSCWFVTHPGLIQ